MFASSPATSSRAPPQPPPKKRRVAQKPVCRSQKYKDEVLATEAVRDALAAHGMVGPLGAGEAAVVVGGQSVRFVKFRADPQVANLKPDVDEANKRRITDLLVAKAAELSIAQRALQVR